MSIYNKLQEFLQDLMAKQVVISKNEIESADHSTVEAFNTLLRYGVPEDRYSRDVVGGAIIVKRLNPNKPDPVQEGLPRTPLLDLLDRREFAARMAHEVNRAYCQSIGDDSQPAWDDAPDWQKDSARNGVDFMWSGEHTPEQSHENWLEVKVKDGWHYGAEKDPVKKTHPCMVPYSQLPEAQRVKDVLFRNVVLAVKALA